MDNLRNKHIHWVVPRYHTNMLPWVKALQGSGAIVSMDVVLQGKTEDYSILSPYVLEQSILSRWLEVCKKAPGTNKPFSFPSIYKYFRHLRRLDPDYVVIRDPSRYVSRLILFYSLFMRFNVICYNQRPIYSFIDLRNQLVIKVFNLFFHARWMSPILGEKHLFKRISNNHFLVPFATEIIPRQKNWHGPVFNLLTIGKFEKRKNHLMLLKVVEQLLVSGMPLNLTIVGELSSQNHQDNYDELIQFLSVSKLMGHCQIYVNLPYLDMKSYYERADIFVLPASNEPASMSVIEALGAGIPVICSNENGTRYYIEEGVNGEIFIAGNQKSLEACILNISKKIQLNPNLFYQRCLFLASQSVSYEQFIRAFRECLN